MGVVRLHRKRHNFSIIDNQGAQDNSLSWKARGILWYLLTKPDDWIVRMTDLISQSQKEGREAVRAGFRELEEAGYALRSKMRGNQGRFEWVTEIFETKEDAIEWRKQNPESDRDQGRFAVGGETVGGKPVDIVITDSDMTELPNTELSNSLSKSDKATGEPLQPSPTKEREFNPIDSMPEPEMSELPEPATAGDRSSGKSKKSRSTRDQQGSETGQDIPRNSSKKENSLTVLRPGRDGVLRLPSKGQSALAGRLTIRALQFQLAYRHLGFEFGKDDDKNIYLRDPRSCEAFHEEEAFGKDGRYPLSMLTSVVMKQYGLTPREINESIEYYFKALSSWCSRQDSNAMKRLNEESVAVLIKGLVEFDPDFFNGLAIDLSAS